MAGEVLGYQIEAVMSRHSVPELIAYSWLLDWSCACCQMLLSISWRSSLVLDRSMGRVHVPFFVEFTVACLRMLVSRVAPWVPLVGFLGRLWSSEVFPAWVFVQMSTDGGKGYL